MPGVPGRRSLDLEALNLLVHAADAGTLHGLEVDHAVIAPRRAPLVLDGEGGGRDCQDWDFRESAALAR